MAKIITLLTDFGVESTYPSQMKGVILGRQPDAVLVDLTHGVPSHDVRTAAFMLAAAVPAFPEGTVHLTVVDPGVGGTRRVLAAEADGHWYVAPDNGILTLVAQGRRLFGPDAGPAAVAAVEDETHYRRDVSSTFHGRDVFAPLAAALAGGVDLDSLGPRIDDFDRVDLPLPERDGGTIRGRVLYVDPFGNLVTNVAGTMLEARDTSRVEIRVSGAVVRGLCRAYCDVPPGILLAYVGSAGLVEVAVNQQSAAVRLAAGIGTPVAVHLPPAP
ncbi:MAG: SAM-dependent chlorinase/fluorinase [Phycisphaerae bacterium]